MPRELDLNQISLFREVVLAGSFSRAAERLKMPKSRVSRQIAGLEHELGVQLIYRTTRQFRLTQTGTELFQKAGPLIMELQHTMEQVTSGSNEVSGLIRATVPEDIGAELMSKLCHDFLTLYPRVEIDLHASNQVVDLVKESIDVAVRIGPARDSTMIRRKVGNVGLVLAASPEFQERHGNPTRLDELEKLPYLSFTPTGQKRNLLKMTNGREQKTLRLSPHFACNNFFVLRAMAAQGTGFAPLPAFLLMEHLAAGSLIQLMKDWIVESSPVQILVPQQKEVPFKIRAFVDFLANGLAASL